MFLRQRGKCAVTKYPMVYVGKRERQRVASLDRIDSRKGYHVENCQLVCRAVNIMKNDMTMFEFRFWCASVVAAQAGRD